MASSMAALIYLSVAIFLLGMAWRISTWLRAPAPLKIPLTPGPASRAGVAGRLAGEVILFRSLYRADKWLWAAGWTFHLALVLLAAGHVGGLVCPDLARAVLGLTTAGFTRMAQFTGGAIGILAVASLLCLLGRRFLIARVRHVSAFSDYFALALLLLMIMTGNHMRFRGGLDIAQAREFVAGLLAFQPAPPPDSGPFVAHMVFACALLVYAPFSKLMHFGGVFFNPALNQRNDPRQRRHVNPWDHETSNA